MTGPGHKTLPEKRYFRIGEVCDITGLKPHVLRYWETEFRQIKPHKTKSNQRLYKKKDVETLLAIKHLLYELKYTIAGARSRLDEKKGPPKDLKPRQLAIEFDPAERDELITRLAQELKQIRDLLDTEVEPT
ncbi:MAG TPA: MerR family transcriptional regulator [bacterium]|nr:MerR family transcriptional regulator [bacterium]